MVLSARAMRANQTDLWVSETAKDLEIYPKDRLFLVGVSGGVDSRVLLQILLDAGFSQLVICHLDHRLRGDRKSTRLNSSHQIISYAVFCLKKKKHDRET